MIPPAVEALVSKGHQIIIETQAGAGSVGLGAARYAVGLGADVTLLDIDLDRLRDIRQKIFLQIKTLYLNSYSVRQILPKIDFLVNAVKWPPQSDQHIVTREMLKIMKSATAYS